MNVQLPKEYKVRKKRYRNIYNMYNNMCCSINSSSNSTGIRRKCNKQSLSCK